LVSETLVFGCDEILDVARVGLLSRLPWATLLVVLHVECRVSPEIRQGTCEMVSGHSACRVNAASRLVVSKSLQSHLRFVVYAI